MWFACFANTPLSSIQGWAIFDIFVRKKIDEVAKEMQQLENNLGFFSNAKPDNPLVLNVINRVNAFKEDLTIWNQKLDYIKKLDY